MLIKGSNSEERLDFFADLYQIAKNNLNEEIENMTTWRKQYEGSPEIDGSTEQACAVRNITYELIESQISSVIPTCKCRPRSWSAENDRCAKNAERLSNMQRDRLPFEKLNDMDERYTYIFGGSVWLVEWDESIKTHYTSGDIKLTLVSPQDFFPQPYITDEDDLEYFFVRFLTTKDDIMRTYDIDHEEAMKTTVEEGTKGYAAVEGDEGEGGIATVVVCYYKDADGLIGRFVFSGDVVLSDIRDYYARKKKRCTKCGRAESICTCDHPKIEEMEEEYEELDRDIVIDGNVVIPSMQEIVHDDGSVAMETVTTQAIDANGMMVIGADGLPVIQEVQQPKMRKTRIPYYKPKTLPIVIRRNTSQDGSIYGQSDCAFIRPQQQQINKIESRIHEKLMKSGITPCLPEDARFELNNAIFGEVLKLKPNENKNDYGTIDMTPNIQQDIQQAERIYQHARYILGITRSYQGQEDTTAKSGIAKQAQIQQAAGRLESKRRMKNFAYSQLDRIIFEQTIAYADEPRPISFRDEFGTMHNETFNRYAFVRRDEETGDYFYDDEYIFSTDNSGGLEDQREAMWEFNRQNFIDGAFGIPGDAGTNLRYWRAQSKAHYPNADDIVEYWQTMYQAQQNQAMAQNALNAAAADPRIMEMLKNQGGMNNNVTGQ